MLSANGFTKVYNLSGGIKAWNNKTAFGPEDMGLELFSGHEAPAQTLIVAYSLEQGLRDFYLTMTQKVTNDAAKNLFKKLAAIEVKHQESVFRLYLETAGDTVSQQDFEKTIVVGATEGGLTTKEYIERFHPDWESVAEIISIAMSIEAQALDLYVRAAERNTGVDSKKALSRIASEEKSHLEQLGQLLDKS